MKSVLLIGQSNMAGRGYLYEVTPIYNENIFMLRNGRWQMMTEPIHFDRSVAGAGPAASFAQASVLIKINKLDLFPARKEVLVLMNGIGKDLCFAMQSARQSLLWKQAS